MIDLLEGITTTLFQFPYSLRLCLIEMIDLLEGITTARGRQRYA